MKVFLYEGGKQIVGKSGVGVAIKHQKSALNKNQMPVDINTFKESDIVQLNTVLPDSVILALMSKIRGKKIVYYGHSTMEDFKNSFVGSNIMAPLFKKWITFCYGLGDILITPTEYSKNIIENYDIKSEIVALSNGIDLEFFSRKNANESSFREKYGFTKEDKVIVSVGHYIERKGIVDFVELAKKMPEYKFVWFGYTDEALITKSVKEALHEKLPNLIFPGFVTKEELRDAYSGADLFLFMSKEETEGIVILEAMAMEIPIVLRDIPVYEGWIEDGVNAYKAKTEEEFIKAIEKMKDPKTKDIVKSAYETAKERDIKEIGKKLKLIYNSLTKEDESKSKKLLQ